MLPNDVNLNQPLNPLETALTVDMTPKQILTHLELLFPEALAAGGFDVSGYETQEQ